jgi:hypothetical protein
MTEIDLILRDLGEIYKNAHDIAVRTNHPIALKICNLCNELASQYSALKKEKEAKTLETERNHV